MLRIVIIIFAIIRYSLHELCVHCCQCNHYNSLDAMKPNGLSTGFPMAALS